MSDKRFVQIHHDELGDSEVRPSALHVWLERGWTVVEDEPAASEGSAQPKASPATRPHPVHATHKHKQGDVTAPAESA